MQMKPISRFLIFVCATGAAFGIGGGLIGALIGTLAPNCYRTLFTNGTNPDFNPVQFGIGLGVTQGLVIGIAVAVVLVLSSAIGGRDRRALVGNQPFWVALCAVAIVLCSGAAFLLGGISGQGRLYNRIVDRKIYKIERVLDSNLIETIEINEGSGGQVYLSGGVASGALRATLQEALAVEFGEREAQALLRSVDVSE